ncbi:hypothetical protein CEQ90_15350, partial [Lewinellaceae bacterium SD302]
MKKLNLEGSTRSYLSALSIGFVILLTIFTTVNAGDYASVSGSLITSAETPNLAPPPEDCNNPLVGKPVVIDRVTTGTLGVLLGGSTLENVIDSTLNNFAEFDLSASLLGSSLVSIKSTDGEYPAGRRVGFVVEVNNSLLSVDILSGLEIRTYQDNELRETATFSGSTIDLSLLGGGGRKQRIEFVASQSFDEVELALGSVVNLNLAGDVRVFYAYEEDVNCDAECSTEVIPANGFTPTIVDARTGFTGGICILCDVIDEEEAINDDLTDGAQIIYGVTLAGTYGFSVSTGSVQPAGSEAGFVVAQNTLLNLLDINVLSKFTIETYNGGVLQEAIELNDDLAGVGILTGGNMLSLSIPTALDYDEVRLVIQAGLAALENLTIFNAFVRYDDDSDGIPNCIDKCVGDDNILNDLGLPLACNPNCRISAGPDLNVCADVTPGMAQLPPALGGQSWMPLAGNPSSATIDPSGSVTGLDAEGLYGFVLSEGACADTVFIDFSESMPSVICNDPVTGSGVVIDDAGAFNGVCLLCADTDATNVTDTDLTNFLEYSSLLTLLSQTSLVSVKDTNVVYPAGMRAGFVVDFPTGLLDATVLGGLELRTYLDDNLQEVSGGGNLLEAAVLPQAGGDLQRIGFTTTQDFDEIEIIFGSAANVLSSIRIYYAFVENSSCDFSTGSFDDPSVLCIEPLTSSSDYCASVNAERTGFSGLACVGCDLDSIAHLVDENPVNSANLNLVAGVANEATVAVISAITIPAGYEAGFLIRGNNALLDLTTLSNLSISTYLDGDLQESFFASNPLINVSLFTSGDDFSLISFKTSEDFDEIVISLNGLVNASLLGGLDIYYAYVRSDIDNDGVPDCLDKCCAGNDLLDSDGNGVPDACDGSPVANRDTVIITTMSQEAIMVLINDDFGEDGPDTLNPIQITNLPELGNAEVDNNGTSNTSGDDFILYTPLATSGIDALTYMIRDANGSSDTASLTLRIEINEAPIAIDDAPMVDEDDTLTDNVVDNDTDVDGPDTLITLVTDVTNGTLTLNPDGSYTYVPDADYNGPDSFAYSYCDGGMPELCDTATVNITVTPVNDAPDAMDDAPMVDEDDTLTDNVVDNDTDVDGPDTLITLVTDVTNGTLTLNPDGSYTYVPDADYNGPDSFVYSYCDGGIPELCDTATVNITVVPVNDPPVITPPDTVMVIVPEDTPDTTCFVITDADAGDVLDCTLTMPGFGTAVLLDDTCVVYTPQLDYNGGDTLLKITCDQTGNCDTVVIIYEVTPVNDAPDAMDDAPMVDEDATLTDNVVDNDTDVDGPDTLITLVTDVTNGTLTLNLDGSYTYIPDADYSGPDSFVYS